MKKIITTIGMIIIGLWILGFILDATLHLAGALLLVAFWGTVVLGAIGLVSLLWEKLFVNNSVNPEANSTVRKP